MPSIHQVSSHHIFCSSADKMEKEKEQGAETDTHIINWGLRKIKLKLLTTLTCAYKL
jgi:hypothetical protein